MKMVLTLSEGSKIVADVLSPIKRKRWETQSELEQRIVDELNQSQPHAVNKVVKCHLLRN